MRISDWSSDVCSSDLLAGHADDKGIIEEIPVIGFFGLGEIEAAAVDRLAARGDIAVVEMRVMQHQHGMDQEPRADHAGAADHRSEEHTSELQSLMRNSYAVFCLKKKNKNNIYTKHNT